MGSKKLPNHGESSEPTGEILLEQAEALVWLLLDDEIVPADLKRLEAMMRDSEQVRQRYISCVQMHVDLHGHFRHLESQPTGEQMPNSPVLGLLGELRVDEGARPPVSD